MKEDSTDNELPGTSCPRTVEIYFVSSTYLCGKFSAFTIYNLFSLQSRCSMLALKELDLNCGGKGRGGFRNLNPLLMMFRKMCFFTSEKIILIEAESGNELCCFQRGNPSLAATL